MNLFPDRLRVGPLRAGAFRSPLHDERTAAVLGVSLGVAFGLCFLTGVVSHLVQHPPGWFTWPSRPAGLYRVNQGVHVASGIAAIPLLLAKLWVVYPRLFTWPPVTDIAHGVERAGLLLLVGGGVFQLMTGVQNIALWYPWGFFFPAAHYAGAWITIGALVAHIGAKAATTRRALTRPESSGAIPPTLVDDTAPAPVLGRRGFLGAVYGAAGVLTVATVGQTVAPLRRLSWLAPRDPDIGPQGLPVNKTAGSAGVRQTARDPDWHLEVTGAVPRPLRLSRAELTGMDQHEARLPITSVEGWSANADWRGVRVRDLLALAGAPEGCEVDVESLQEGGRYRASVLNSSHAGDRDTLLALEVNGEDLHIDHGFPLRLIAPNRPGVLQTKWVSKLVVRAS
ncbi:MAG: molybdopterin-dependent oxidoreductase [Acidimicrobiia bacterium]